MAKTPSLVPIRYMEGRKLWSAIALSSRNLAQIVSRSLVGRHGNLGSHSRGVQIWIHVPFERTNKKTGQQKSVLEITIEKKSMINLVQAYSVAVKVNLTLSGRSTRC